MTDPKVKYPLDDPLMVLSLDGTPIKISPELAAIELQIWDAVAEMGGHDVMTLGEAIEMLGFDHPLILALGEAVCRLEMSKSPKGSA